MANDKCPVCGGTMKPAGQINAGPRGGKRKVVKCEKCGYRSLDH